MAFFGKQKYDVAISCLKQAIYLDAFDPQINFNLGTNVIRLGSI